MLKLDLSMMITVSGRKDKHCCFCLWVSLSTKLPSENNQKYNKFKIQIQFYIPQPATAVLSKARKNSFYGSNNNEVSISSIDDAQLVMVLLGAGQVYFQ